MPRGKIWKKDVDLGPGKVDQKSLKGGLMASRKREDKPSTPKRPPATTPEARENQMIALAFDVAEKQMRDGTASSQVITQFLKLGSGRERLEQERLRHENELLQAKAEAMASQRRIEELYGKALEAMRSYAGQDPLPDEDDDYD